MAVLKLSGITTTTPNPATTDYAVSVLSGSTDTLVTYSQVATTISPIITLVSSQIPTLSATTVTGTFASSQIPAININASGITTGTISTTVLPVISLTSTTAGGVTGILPAINVGSVAPANYLSGQWYSLLPVIDTQGGQSTATNTIYMSFGYVPQNVTIKGLAIRSTSGGASGNVQLAIYSYSGTTLTLVDKTGNITTQTATVLTTTSLGNTTDVLSAGTLYAFCSNASVGLTYQAYGNLQAMSLVGTSTPANGLGVISGVITGGKSASSTFSTWPATISTASLTDLTSLSAPQIIFQVN